MSQASAFPSDRPMRLADAQAPWAWWAALVIVLLATILARGSIALRPGYPGAIDAAYYPVQSRSLLEGGKLVYPDVPLKFAIDAALGSALHAVRGGDRDAALLLASRLTDAILPAFIVVPIFLLGRSWAGQARDRVATGLCLAAAASVAALSLPIVDMILDFQKNSLGLVWFAGAAWACQRALAGTESGAMPRRLTARWLPLAAMMLLAALTHVGALGATLLTVGTACLLFFGIRSRLSVGRWAALSVAAVLAAALVLVAVYAVAPNKAMALLNAPSAMFAAGRGGPGGPGGGFHPGGPAGTGGVLQTLARSFGPWLLVYPAVLWALVVLARARRHVALADASLVLGVSVTALVLAFPLLNDDYARRLSLMSPAAVSILLAFIFGQRLAAGRRPWSAAVIGPACLLSLAIGAGWLAMNRPSRETGRQAEGPSRRGPGPGGGMPGPGMMNALPDGADAELRAVGEIAAQSPRPLIIARHGLEFWAEYFTKLSCRQRAPDNA
ncbi:MAG: hypothetical protein K2Q20_01420, partial [Phycisphaerales bacterium]|nr:hypothetical protein [Phycisphaerales bacterium]